MKGKIIWIYGQPEAGKTTLALEFLKTHPNAIHIDGDDLRALTKNVDYSRHGRMKNIYKAQTIASFLSNKGFTIVVSMVTPYKFTRDDFKRTSNVLFVCVGSNRLGRILNHSAEFERDADDLFINTDIFSIEEAFAILMEAATKIN